MQQAWHIFKKDVRGLRLEIVNYLAAILVAGWLTLFSIGVAEVLVAFTAAFLLAGLIHADAPAGDRQFWVTRPYRWQSLLGSKLLFIFLVLDLPVCLAQWMLLVYRGFPWSGIWSGLLWEQFLLLFGAFLPLAAVAALTRGLVAFMSIGLVAALGEVGFSFLIHLQNLSLRSLEWVRLSFGFVLLLATSAIVIWLQYRWRSTTRSRLTALGILVPGVAAGVVMPWSVAFAIQQRFSTDPLNPSAIKVSLDSTTAHWGLAPVRGQRVQVSLLLELQGLPPGDVANAEFLRINVHSADGRESRLKGSGLPALRVAPDGAGTILAGNGELDRSFFDAEREHPVTLHGTLYLTVFGNKRVSTISLDSSEPIQLTDNMRCLAGPFGLMCESPFRWPDKFISVGGATSGLSIDSASSHSPFPAELRFYPFNNRWAPPPARNNAPRMSRVREATVEIAEPVAYVRREFEAPNVHLTDIAVPWQTKNVLRDGKTISESQY